MTTHKHTVSEEQLNKMLSALTEMGKKPKFLTLQQAIGKMRPKILLALQQGYTQQDVVALLKTHELQISLRTLRLYLKTADQAGDDQTGDQTGDLKAGEAVTAQTAQTDPVVAASVVAKTAQPTETVSKPAAVPAASNTASNAASNGKDEAAMPATPETPTVAQANQAKPTTPVAANPSAKPERPKAMLPLSTPSQGRKTGTGTGTGNNASTSQAPT